MKDSHHIQGKDFGMIKMGNHITIKIVDIGNVTLIFENYTLFKQ